jgi:L-ascorbate metabolism protein UlaG (beta-lactamase superfamily)
MKRRLFIRDVSFGGVIFSFSNNRTRWFGKTGTMKVRLLRHATLVIDVNGKRVMVGPMLGKKESMDPVANAANANRIPLVDLPINDHDLDDLLHTTDMVLLTHIHRDHWDAAAQQMIGKNKLILCQPADEEKIRALGFTNVKNIENMFTWNDVTIYRTNGKHGTGEIGRKMGIVSGYVLTFGKERLYIAGDTIWCEDVKQAITTHLPTHIIINGGGARFLEGDPITMTISDVLEVSQFTPVSLSVVHLDTVNHCLQKRPDFRAAIKERSLDSRISVPNDGDWLKWT